MDVVAWKMKTVFSYLTSTLKVSYLAIGFTIAENGQRNLSSVLCHKDEN